MLFPETDPSPTELRERFGRNLQQLVQSATSISALCRELGINRTQFNRYRSGESFPRPDVLFRICRYFKVDARILLEPVEALSDNIGGLLDHPELAGFSRATERVPTDDELPSGLYAMSRSAQALPGQYAYGLVSIYRRGTRCFLRGYAPSLDQPRIPAPNREFRGAVIARSSGFTLLQSRRDSDAVSVVYFTPGEQGPTGTIWTGQALCANGEAPMFSSYVLETIDQTPGAALRVARASGFMPLDTLPPAHRACLTTQS